MMTQQRLVPPSTRRPGVPIKRPTTVVELLDLTPDLPPLPAVAMATHREAGKVGANAHTVASLVNTDPALTVRVLRLANSAFYGSARQVCSVPEAVILLGMKTVRNLCLVAGTYPWLSGGLPAYGLAPGALLSHSLAAAVGSRAIAKKMGLDDDAAFSAGLLHDLGKVGLAMWFKAEHGTVHNWMEERRAIGFDHGQIGGELARRWNLPDALVNAITCHHMPCEGLEDAVYLGDILAYLIENGEPPRPDPEPLLRCGLEVPDLVTLAEELMPEYQAHTKLAEACA